MNAYGRTIDGVEVWVTQHARERGKERFPRLRTGKIAAEVVQAVRQGRISASKPPGLNGFADPHGLYVWTRDGCRIYVVRPTRAHFIVLTTLRPEGR